MGFEASPKFRDVTKVNVPEIIYIKGNEVTDGSIRIEFTAGDTFAHIESRANGVWNDSGLRVSPNTLQIGRDISLSSAAGWLETDHTSAQLGHPRSLIPHVEFEDEGTGLAHSPKAGPLRIFPVYEGAVGEQIGTVLSQVFNVTPSRVLNKVFHEVGSVGATAPVTHRLYTGSDNTGTLFSEFVLPPEDVVANTTLTINYDKDLGFTDGQNFFMELSSTQNFSLKTDSGGNLLTIHQAQELRELDIILDQLVVGKDADLVFANDASLIIYDPFRAANIP